MEAEAAEAEAEAAAEEEDKPGPEAVLGEEWSPMQRQPTDEATSMVMVHAFEGEPGPWSAHGDRRRNR